MDFQYKWIVLSLLVIQLVWLANGQEDPCNDTCTVWERCVEDDGSSLALTNLPGPFPQCVLTNECEVCDVANGFTCCGHDHCECTWPRFPKNGLCLDAINYCPSDRPLLATNGVTGVCICDDHHVFVAGEGCVLCNPELTCPNCTEYGRICAFAPGNPMGTCECPPGQVENKTGICIDCIPCPEECKLGQVCLTDLTSRLSVCGCPPETRDEDGKCVPTPACPECNVDQVCVIHGAEATCECPENTVWMWNQCMPIAECPDCPDHEVCVIPHDGEAPYCKCQEGYLRDISNVCSVTCSGQKDHVECFKNEDCNHGKLCTNGQCECPKNYTPRWGRCIRPGMAGGLCRNGQCFGKHVSCGSNGYCECSNYCYKDPQPVCIKK